MTMKAIAKFPYRGNTVSELSFPAGAVIGIKSDSIGVATGGWIVGMYNGERGWFPSSYVEVLPQEQPPLYSDRQTQQQHEQNQRRNAIYLNNNNSSTHNDAMLSPQMSYQNYQHTEATSQQQQQQEMHRPPISLVSFDASDDLPNQDATTETDDFPLMGGEPGKLFGVPIQTMQSIQEEVESQATSSAEPPVDLYRHGGSRKKGIFSNIHKNKAEYNPEISVQITSKATTTATKAPSPSFGSRSIKVAPQQPTTTAEAQDFWRAHPARTGGTSAEQSYTLERAFTGIIDKERIAIVEESPQKKRFPRLTLPKNNHGFPSIDPIKSIKKMTHTMTGILHVGSGKP